jgi:phospholipid/cholesterol/gamma-HCH transport system permease protein
MRNFFTFIGEVSHFGLKGLVGAFRPPFEWEFFVIQIEEIGWRSLPLILAAGFALGVVLSLHTRGTLVQFGAEGLIPTLQSASFFNELGPLVTALLVAGRVGAGIGAGRKTGAVRDDRPSRGQAAFHPTENGVERRREATA